MGRHDRRPPGGRMCRDEQVVRSDGAARGFQFGANGAAVAVSRHIARKDRDLGQEGLDPPKKLG